MTNFKLVMVEYITVILGHKEFFNSHQIKTHVLNNLFLT